MEGQVMDNSTVEATAPVTGQAVSSTSETQISQNGQATPQPAQGAPVEESFTTIDPKTLTPELQAHYKSMQADYTKKAMAIAEKEKTFTDLSKKAESYDQLTKDQKFKDYWNNMNRGEKAEFKEQKAEVEKSLGQKITDDEFAKSFESKDGFLSLLEKVSQEVRAKDQKKISELEQKVTASEANNIVESVATEIGTDGKLARPDFYTLDEDSLISGYLSVNPASSTVDYKDKVTEAYNWAKSISSKYFEKGRQEGLKIVQAKVQNSTEMPTLSSKNAYTGKDPKLLTHTEAIDLARRGIRVPQN